MCGLVSVVGSLEVYYIVLCKVLVLGYYHLYTNQGPFAGDNENMGRRLRREGKCQRKSKGHLQAWWATGEVCFGVEE